MAPFSRLSVAVSASSLEDVLTAWSSEVMRAIARFFARIWNSTCAAISSQIARVAKALSSFLGNMWTSALHGCARFTHNIAMFFKDIAYSTAIWCQGILRGMATFVLGTWRSIVHHIASVLAGTKSSLGHAFSAAGSFVTDALRKLLLWTSILLGILVLLLISFAALKTHLKSKKKPPEAERQPFFPGGTTENSGYRTFDRGNRRNANSTRHHRNSAQSGRAAGFEYYNRSGNDSDNEPHQPSQNGNSTRTNAPDGAPREQPRYRDDTTNHNRDGDHRHHAASGAARRHGPSPAEVRKQLVDKMEIWLEKSKTKITAERMTALSCIPLPPLPPASLSTPCSNTICESVKVECDISFCKHSMESLVDIYAQETGTEKARLLKRLKQILHPNHPKFNIEGVSGRIKRQAEEMAKILSGIEEIRCQDKDTGCS